MNWYRPFASVIGAALKRGWRVECWHDIGTPMPERPADFPSIAAAPFPASEVLFREYRGFEELSSLMSRKTVDVVVNTIPPVGARADNWPRKSFRPLYVCINGSPMDCMMYVRDEENVRQVDMFSIETPYWVKPTINTVRETDYVSLSTEVETELRRKCRPVGWPSVDQRTIIDPTEVRRRWDIPERQPVVVYFNWGDGRSVGLRAAMYSAVSIRDKAAALIRHFKEWRFALKALLEPGINSIMRAIRTFCDRNDAFLIVKHRHRDNLWPAEITAADKVIVDESYYPHTIWQVMSIADLAMGYFSFAVRESVASKVPYLALDVAGFVDQVYFQKQGPFLSNLAGKNGFFNFPGVVRTMDDSKIVNQLPQMSLADFQMDSTAYDEYYAKYLAVPGAANSELFLDEIQKLIAKERGVLVQTSRLTAGMVSS
ncbi:MAG: hypothetical protein JXB42_07075 [Deltaproteobacteria bacterium]|nr:hypothetical protein [Deltaproteobacteria bacterium]